MGKFSQRDQFYTPAPLFLRGQIFEEEDSFRGRRNCVDQNSPLIHPFHTDVLNVFEQNLGKVLLADDVLKLSGDNCLKMTAKITTFLNEHVPLGGRVAVLFPPSAMQGLSILSVISSGRVPVILNHWMDHHEVERLSQLRNFHAVIHGEIIKRPEIDDLPSMRFSLGGKLESVFKTDNKRAVPLPHPETAVVLFTSGSMGEPKAVALSKNGLSYIISTLIKYFQLGADSHAIITLQIGRAHV